jgi:hypothetical protein
MRHRREREPAPEDAVAHGDRRNHGGAAGTRVAGLLRCVGAHVSFPFRSGGFDYHNGGQK